MTCDECPDHYHSGNDSTHQDRKCVPADKSCNEKGFLMGKKDDKQCLNCVKCPVGESLMKFKDEPSLTGTNPLIKKGTAGDTSDTSCKAKFPCYKC